MAPSRALRRRKRRKRKRKLLVALLMIMTLTVAGYTAVEYINGKQNAEGKSSANAEDTLEKEKSEYAKEWNGTDNGDGKTNVLLLGSDQRENEEARTDTIMIAQYEPGEQSAKLVSLMRDTYVKIPGHGYNKINAAFAIGGPELMRKTIKENFGVEMEYFAVVDFDGFTEIVDTIAPNGLEIDVEKDMYYQDSTGIIDLEEGTQKLSGKELLGYARFRKDQEGDYGRVRRQQQVISRLKEELISLNGVLKAPRLIGTVQPYMDMNIGTGKTLSLGKDFLLNPVEDIEKLRIPTDENVWNERKEYPIGLVLAHDEEKTKETIQEFLK
ncbi:LCP family protein [Salimicrobium halophilum]|uniref:Regulatory protein MsrR n=1 Tax=Salimicrobium halophilum TaxID=86666 RepID=A0A1G8TSQ9_9BACI|nr:LCP family protein [Salimicrobium halophilum]SDJ44562.1 cell envelope-related function transcriptional attenuator common domain-containing protein [Salimicrobium halophilum]